VKWRASILEDKELFEMIYDSLMNLLTNGKIGPDGIDNEFDRMYDTFSQYYSNANIDKEKMVRKIIHDYGIFAGTAKALEDNTDHQEWLAEERSKISWNFWGRYKKYLNVGEKLPKQVVKSVDQASDEVLKRLESPNREGSWDRRGMVVGNVQSGKTSNYIGLICKAVDSGYKMIIVLAGLNNDLRSQTQKRIDNGFIGRDTRKKDQYNQTSSKIGAGLLPGFPEPHVIALTSADSSGDFKKNVHSAVTITPGGDPIIAVVKKNVTPLRNLLNWFQSSNASGKIMNVPLLLIDDEADNASIDTKALKKIGTDADNNDIEEQDPTRINGLIRQILNCFTQSAYVGYTATPFANIFIYPTDKEDMENDYGEDLYPRSFIVNLHAPSNYIGPEKVFGLFKDRTANIDEVKPLPLTRVADDYHLVFPEKHKSNLKVTSLPDSLLMAVYSFILSAAARDARGQGDKHNSMLVHVTRFVDVQTQITELLQELCNEIVAQLEFKTGPQYENLMGNLKYLWENDYVPTTRAVIENCDDNGVVELQWDEIEPRLYHCASKIEVKAVNGKAADGGLNYDLYTNGCTVIAVGGDKLSRGLTLEGLTISYYSRVSKMYDTLLQMGRWFGYRSGYVDLCRLYTSSTLIQWYRHIAVANEELRRELDDMAELGATPESYGLKVRTHPDGMIVTAMNKMKNSEKRTVTYAGKLVQITHYYKNNPCNQRNIEYTDKWLKSLGQVCKVPSKLSHNNYLWEDVHPEKILEFIQNVSIHQSCFNASPKLVSQYITNQNIDGELVNWTVALISVGGSNPKEIGGQSIGLSWRTDQEYDDDNDTVNLISNNLITETDQDVDLTVEEMAMALKQTQEHWIPNGRTKDMPTTPSPVWIRRNRKITNGLLMIYVFQSGKIENGIKIPYNNTYVGYAISFPDSETARPVEYKVDEVYLKNDNDEE
jgi:hypothetical protein